MIFQAGFKRQVKFIWKALRFRQKSAEHEPQNCSWYGHQNYEELYDVLNISNI